MSALTAMQAAAVRLISRKPSAFFASTDTFALEMTNLLNEVARDITLSHDWQALTKTHTLVGDGTNTNFAKPTDYDRMPVGGEVADGASWFWNYSMVPDMNMWIALQNGFYLGATPPGWWMLIGDEFRFAPAPGHGATATFPYISNRIVRTESGAERRTFTSDSDTFKLDERLLTLGLIWRWREMKNLDSTGDQANFEKAFSEAAARDRGSHVIRIGRRNSFPGAVPAWPWELG